VEPYLWAAAGWLGQLGVATSISYAVWLSVILIVSYLLRLRGLSKPLAYTMAVIAAEVVSWPLLVAILFFKQAL
jgi:hypothetical protein